MKLHESLTEERIIDAAQRVMFGTENLGFCVACGEETDGVEPDARNFKCHSCGEMKVFGAEELLIHAA